jgi:hypothetical protein
LRVRILPPLAASPSQTAIFAGRGFVNERETQTTFDLTNGATIEVHVASFKTTRGYTIVAALCDEIAFWPHAAEPDYEVLNALRPGMATIPNAMLLCASSPYARRGALWDAHRRHWAKDNDPVLVWRAATRDMNPTVPQQVIDAATEQDPASAAAEYLAEFRTDVEALLTREGVEACVAWDVRERAPMQSEQYCGVVDPSGGSADSMTLSIGHRESDVVVLDAVRERRPPFSPEDVVGEFAALLRAYRVQRVTGDCYVGEWPRERFREHGITYEPAQKPKSDLYRDLLPAINSRKLDLLDDPRLITGAPLGECTRQRPLSIHQPCPWIDPHAQYPQRKDARFVKRGSRQIS